MAIGRVYTVAIGNETSGTTAKTLIEVAGAADSVTYIERAWVTNSSQATGEQLGTKIQRITTTGTGTATVPEPLQVGDTAFGGVVETDATVEPTYAAGTEIYEAAWSVLAGFLWTPANDDEVIVLSPSALIGINMDVAPAVALNLSYGCTIREIGG